MPALRVARREKFAQLVAKGLSNMQAALQAGYAPRSARQQGCVLRKDPEVAARIEELVGKVVEGVVERTVADRTWVERNLIEIVERCMQARPVLDAFGAPVMIEIPGRELADGTKEAPRLAAAYKFDARGATAALALLGTELGMFVRRTEQGKAGEFGLPRDPKEQEALLVRVRAERARRLGKPALVAVKK